MRPRTSLPQHATPAETAVRAAQLTKRQTQYVYESPDHLPGIAFIKGPFDRLPGQTPSLTWFSKIALHYALLYSNRFAAYNPLALLRALLTPLHHHYNPHNPHNKSHNNPHPHAAAQPQIQDNKGDEGEHADCATALDDIKRILRPYRRQYRILRRPPITDVFLEDRIFARLRVAGFNPMSLFRVRTEAALPFHPSPQRLHMPTPADSLKRAIAEHRLYALDFTDLAILPPQPDSPKTFTPTKALFILPSTGADLQPLAIDVGGDVVYPPSKSKPLSSVSTPTSSSSSSSPQSPSSSSCSVRWELAKLAVNTCDAFHHEIVSHLGRTHLLLEPFVAATMRQLPPAHPLHALLLPHLEGTAFINEYASKNLLCRSGNVDHMFAGDIHGILTYCVHVVRTTRFNACFPDVELAARGVDDPTLHFPYRDDALAHFTALHAWVSAYICHFYTGDDDVAADTELTAWAHELSNTGQGRVCEFGDFGDGRILTRAYLIRAVAFVIFSASVQHAAVNFPQKTLMSFAPALAGAQFQPPPARGGKCDVGTFADSLVPLAHAQEQIHILTLLGGIHYTRLGQYRWRQFRQTGWQWRWPKEIREAHELYVSRLDEINEGIVRRERGQELKYEYLRPRNIPQSINI